MWTAHRYLYYMDGRIASRLKYHGYRDDVTRPRKAGDRPLNSGQDDLDLGLGPGGLHIIGKGGTTLL